MGHDGPRRIHLVQPSLPQGGRTHFKLGQCSRCDSCEAVGL